MDPGLYIAASGMLAGQVRQNQLTNDLSNASTPGYKVDNATQQSFGSLLLSNTATGQPIGNLQTGVRVDSIVTDLTPAPLHETGQPLDFGIAGAGFFAVQSPQGIRYTRDGQFSSSAQGVLVDSQGNQVLSQNGAAIPVGSGGQVAASALGVFNVTGATKQGYNQFAGTAAGQGSGVVRQGELEQSAVDPVHTMVDMISALRTYQTSENAIQTIDQTLQQSAATEGAVT
jgi:flagellar basal-body rod protein FlgG